MTKKTLFCAVLASTLGCVPSFAGDAPYYEPRGFGHHRSFDHRRALTWRAARPAVVRGYYPEGYGLAPRIVRRSFDLYSQLPEGYVPPMLAYRQATAFVPVTTYAPVPVRIYYVPQEQPYYNVPPYAVRVPCICD